MRQARLTPRPAAVLFDLDGTLIDSAPDLAGALNDMRLARGLEAMSYPPLRAQVGSGARGMLGTGLGIAPDDAEYATLRSEFLARYDARKTRETRVFAEMRPVLDAFARHGIAWGIVTNKAEYLARPLIDAIGGLEASRTLVCGDTLAQAKPHPAPLLEAARRLAVAPSACIYVGDDLRDVQAGRAAGMRTVVAHWGYLGADARITEWQADVVIDRPSDLLGLVGLESSPPAVN